MSIAEKLSVGANLARIDAFSVKCDQTIQDKKGLAKVGSFAGKHVVARIGYACVAVQATAHSVVRAVFVVLQAVGSVFTRLTKKGDCGLANQWKNLKANACQIGSALRGVVLASSKKAVAKADDAKAAENAGEANGAEAPKNPLIVPHSLLCKISGGLFCRHTNEQLAAEALEKTKAEEVNARAKIDQIVAARDAAQDNLDLLLARSALVKADKAQKDAEKALAALPEDSDKTELQATVATAIAARTTAQTELENVEARIEAKKPAAPAPSEEEAKKGVVPTAPEASNVKTSIAKAESEAAAI